MAIWDIEGEALRQDLDAVFSSLRRQDVKANMWSPAGSVTFSITERLLLTHDLNIMAVFEWAHSKFAIHSVHIHGHSRWRKTSPASVNKLVSKSPWDTLLGFCHGYKEFLFSAKVVVGVAIL